MREPGRRVNPGVRFTVPELRRPRTSCGPVRLGQRGAAYACLRVTGYLGMDIPRFVALVSARRRMIAGMAIGAAALALIASLTQDKQYRAGADLWFGSPTNAEALVPGATDPTQRPDREAATNLALASLDTVAARVRERFGGRATIEQLRDAVSIEAQGESDVVTVSARSDSPAQAARLANAFAGEIVALRQDTARADVQRAIDVIDAAVTARTASGRRPDARTRALQGRAADLEVIKALQSGSVQLVERATPPQHASSPRPGRNAALAAFVAVAVGLLLIITLTRAGDGVGDDEAIAAIMGAPILARIPATSRLRGLRQRAPAADPEFLEAFEFLRLNLEPTLAGEQGRVVAITSPTASEGKSTVTAWLARSFAGAQDEVATLDMDLSRPALGSYLTLESDDRIRLLSARDQLGVRPGLVSKARMQELFADLREDADIVLVDTGPVSLAADTTAVVAAADGVVLVIDATRVRRRDLLAARRQLDKARVWVIGIVLNRDPGDRKARGRRRESPVSLAARTARRMAAAGSSVEHPNS
jgi:succinoglycan biosynthesis transport protein ExoP